MKIFIWKMLYEQDKLFTEKLFERFMALAKSLGILDFIIEIREKYLTEGDFHYHVKVGPDSCSNQFTEKNCIIALYSATANGETFDGEMKMIVQSNAAASFNSVLVHALFVFYDEYIREYYPGWKTTYKMIDPN